VSAAGVPASAAIIAQAEESLTPGPSTSADRSPDARERGEFARVQSFQGRTPLQPKPPLPALRSYQAEAKLASLDSALNGRGLTFTVVMARQAGKNELSAQVELQLLITNAWHAADGIKCAPTFEPQARISLSRLWGHIVQAGLDSDAAREGRLVRFGHARQIFLSAEPSANVVGHTAGLLLEVDEAQDVDRDKFDREFRPMAASTGATTVYYGTPWDDSTLLELAVQTNLELERRDGIRRHFAADWTAVAEWNPQYARYVEGERARLGENHPLFLTQYALKMVSGGGRLFTAAQRAQLQGSHGRQHAPQSGDVYVAGLDLGGQAWENGADAETRARLFVRRLGEDVVRAVRFSAEWKSQLGYGLLAAVQGGRLKMYAADAPREYAEFWREMELARVHYRPSRQMNFFVEPSQGHDDYVVSASLAVEAAKEIETKPRVARGRLSAE